MAAFERADRRHPKPGPDLPTPDPAQPPGNERDDA